MKRHIAILTILLAACFFASCSKEEDTYTELISQGKTNKSETLAIVVKDWGALVKGLMYDYACLPIKAYPMALMRISVTTEGIEYNIKNLVDVNLDGDYDFLMFPKAENAIMNIVDIANSLKTEEPSCSYKITIEDDKKRIRCTMPDMNENWCYVLCGYKDPSQALSNLNNAKDKTNETTGQIQEIYNQKATSLRKKYVAAGKTFQNIISQNEIDAIYNNALEEMNRIERVVLEDLVEANEKWKNNQR